MGHHHFFKCSAYGLVLVLAIQLTACTNTAQNAVETNAIAMQEEVTRPPSVSIRETADETDTSETRMERNTKESTEKETESPTEPEDITEAESTVETEEESSFREEETSQDLTEAETERLSEKETEEQKPSQKETEASLAQTDSGKETEPSTVAGQQTEPATTAKETTSIQQVELPATQTAEYTGTISVKTPSASGTETYTGNGATIDASNKASGYIMAKYEGGEDKRVRVRVSLNDVYYDYDLNTGGSYETYPLQMGNGTYTIIVMQNVYDNQYAVLTTADISVEIGNSLNPYLYPSQKVSFTSSSKAVKKSYDLCVGLTTDEEKVTAIYNYIVQNVKYDYDKAAQVTSGTLTTYNSKADSTLENNKGICMDYATLMAVMLRAQNIPTQMIFGSEASASYHAWNKVYYNGGWVLYDATYGAGGATGSGYTELKRY